MGKVISVASFEELSKASQKLQALSESYSKIGAQLLQEAETMGDGWSGADNLEFVERISSFTNEIKMMTTKLTNASQALEKQKANYVARQESNIAQVKKLAH